MLNKVFIQGNVTRDLEVRTSKAGNKIVKFGLAWNDKGSDGEETAHFYNVVVMGKTADFVESYVKKGSGIIAEGQLRNNRWEAEDGTKRSSHEIFVGFNGSISFSGSKRAAEEGETVAAAAGEGSNAATPGEDKDYF